LLAAAAVPDVFEAELVPEDRDVVDEEVVFALVVLLSQEAAFGKVTPEGVQISCANCCVLAWSAGEHAFATQHERPDIQPDDLQIHATSSCWHPVPELKLLPTQLEAHEGKSTARAVAANATMAEKAERRIVEGAMKVG